LTTLAVQYLEPNPSIATLTPAQAAGRLRQASALLPLSAVLLGWDLPEALVSACAEETRRSGAELYLWHPLLTGNQALKPQTGWQTIGLNGEPVPGHAGLPEFTFLCPNRPAVREAVLDHLRRIIRRGDYQGVFLDRIRYPSPAGDPALALACFCDDCARAAAEVGIDLDRARQHIRRLIAAADRAPSFIQVLMGAPASLSSDPDAAVLQAFLNFRAQSVTRIVQAAAALIHATGLQVGLDCFSPALTRMVGQDLSALAPHCRWIKIMTYGHAFGPAGIPFELAGLLDWLIRQPHVGEATALEWVGQATGLALPPSRTGLVNDGVSAEALSAEVTRGRQAGVRRLYAGLELVEMEGVTRLKRAQIAADLRALRAAGADGLVLSWDLWHIPLERLELVRDVWVG
jgi:hypothetical protein